MKKETKKADISEAQMIADGWVKSTEKPPIFLFEKAIENINPINDDPDDTDIKLVVHCFNGGWSFAVLFPDGGMLNFVANSMAQLKAFEEAITFYDCPY